VKHRSSSKFTPWAGDLPSILSAALLFLLKDLFEPGMVMNAYNPSTWEGEAGSRHGLHSETLPKNKTLI
jgi:hypothetical protein